MWPVVLFLLFRGVYSDSLLISADKGLYLANDVDKTVNLMLNFPVAVYSMDYHYIKRYMYYTLDGAILRRNLDLKSDEEPLRVVPNRAKFFVNNMAVDWVHDRMYWTIGLQAQVNIADLDGKRANLIISADQVRRLHPDYNATYLDNILVDPYEELLFVLATFESESYKSNTILRSNLQGNHLTSSLNPQLKTATSLTLDMAAQRIYAAGIQTGQKHGFLCSVDYNGKNLQQHYKESMKLVHPVHISAGALYMIVHEIGADQGSVGLYKMNLTTTTMSLESENLHFMYIYKIKSFARENQLTPSEFAFSKCDSRSCPYQCIAFPKAGPTCVCRSGEKIAPRSQSCEVGQGVKLLTSDLSRPFSPHAGIIEILPLQSIRQVFAYHYQKDLIFFFSSSDHTIYRSTLSKRDAVEPVVENVDVCAIEVDWVNNNLYWIDEEGMKSSTLDGSLLPIGQQMEFNHSTCDLQVDPYEKYLFFLELGTIGRSNLQGNSIITKAKTDDNEIISSFTIDIKQRKLYFSVRDNPEENEYIASSTYDFSEMVVYPKRLYSSINRMAVYQNELYLNANQDLNASSLYLTKIIGTENQDFQKLFTYNPPLTDLVLYHPKAQMSREDQDCEEKSCSHMCEIVEGGAGLEVACSCPRPMELDGDGITCREVHGAQQELNWLQPKNRRHSSSTPSQGGLSISWPVIALVVAGVVCLSMTLWCYMFKKNGLTCGSHRWEYRENWWRRPETQRTDDIFTSKIRDYHK